MFEAYILPVLIFAALGILAGILLTAASRIFAVKTDERIETVNEALPQINCGACGFSGCSDYARAIVENGEKTNLCKPGGSEAASRIADIMGTAEETAERVTAVVRCSGTCDTEKKDFSFSGYNTCRNAKQYYGGPWSCKYGCIGLGDCAEVCPSGAISTDNGLARVDPIKCIGCGLCAEVCPNDIIDLRSSENRADVLCSSRDGGKAVRAVCKSGCIACKICEKQCEYDAIHVKDNIAVTDYEKCTACGKCAEKCPAKVISCNR